MLDIKTKRCSQVEGKDPTLELFSVHIVSLVRKLKATPDQEEKRLDPDQRDLQTDCPRHLVFSPRPALLEYKTCYVGSHCQLEAIHNRVGPTLSHLCVMQAIL